MSQLSVIFTVAIPFTLGIMIIDESMIINTNSSFIDIKVDIFNENLKDSVIRIVITAFRTIDASWMYLKFTISKNVNQPDYSIVLVNTVVDLKKLMEGAFANPIIRTVYDNLKKNVDFQLKYPFPPGTYTCNNFSLSDKFLPTPFGFKGKIEMRFVSKHPGIKVKVNLANLMFFAEYKLPQSP